MLTPALVAAALAGAAAWLAWRPPGVAPRPLRAGVAGAVVAVGGVLVVPDGWGVPLLLAVGAGVAISALRLRGWRRAAAVEASSRIQVACGGLASSLAAGVPVATALEVAAADWPPLEVVHRSAHLGGRVPERLRTLAEEEPGAGDLRLVAAAWQVAERGGAGLAPAIGSVAGLLRRQAATRRLVRSELASARATARLLAGLPVLTLALGSGLGGNPVAFLLTTPVGLACLGGGLAFAFAGIWWIEGIATAVESGS